MGNPEFVECFPLGKRPVWTRILWAMIAAPARSTSTKRTLTHPGTMMNVGALLLSLAMSAAGEEGDHRRPELPGTGDSALGGRICLPVDWRQRRGKSSNGLRWHR